MADPFVDGWRDAFRRFRNGRRRVREGAKPHPVDRRQPHAGRDGQKDRDETDRTA